MKRIGSMVLVLLFSFPMAAVAQYTPDGEAYNRSYGAESMGDYRRALKELDGLSNSARSTYYYELRRGWLLYLSTQYADSVEAYRKAGKVGGPKAIEPAIGEMLPLMALRRWKDAHSAGTRVIQVAPNNTIALSRMAWCEYNLGRFDAAAKTYQAVLALFPGDLEMRAGLGWSLLKAGQKKAALKEFKAVLAVSPGYGSAQQGLAAAQK